MVAPSELFDNYDLMEVVMIRLDTDAESREKIFDYLKGIFTNDKEKIIKQIGPLPEDVDEEVKSVQGVGLLIYNKGIAEGMTQGRIKALYNDAGFTVEEISEKTNLSEDEIKEILMSDEENC